MVAALIETALPETALPDDRRPEGHVVEGGCVEGGRVERGCVESGRELYVVVEPRPAFRSRRETLPPRSVPSPAVIRRRRLAVGGVAGAILLGLLLGLQALFGRPGGGPLASVGSPAASEPAVARIWVVRPGDTLWSIALASGARGDIRPLVARLSAEVGGRPLQPGERIQVP